MPTRRAKVDMTIRRSLEFPGEKVCEVRAPSGDLIFTLTPGDGGVYTVAVWSPYPIVSTTPVNGGGPMNGIAITVNPATVDHPK